MRQRKSLITLISKVLETSDEWISKMTGIKERRWASENQDTSDLAFEASKKRLKMQESHLLI